MSQVLQQTPAVRQSPRLKPAALPRLALGIAAVFIIHDIFIGVLLALSA
jgi:hypothetical protein